MAAVGKNTSSWELEVFLRSYHSSRCKPQAVQDAVSHYRACAMKATDMHAPRATAWCRARLPCLQRPLSQESRGRGANSITQSVHEVSLGVSWRHEFGVKYDSRAA